MTEKPTASLWQTLSGWMGTRRVRGREAKARRAEARGDLAKAAEIYLQMDAREDALRVTVLRAESVLEPSERLRLWTLAGSLALDAERREFRLRAALLKLELLQAKRLVLTNHEVSLLGSELLNLDRPRLAAEAYREAGDLEGETRALVEAGAIEQLEAAFDAQHERQHRQRTLQRVLHEATDLYRIGRRRASLALIEAQGSEASAELGELRHRIIDSRLTTAGFLLETQAGPRRYLLGNRIALGRSPGGIQVASPALSREHLVFELSDGQPTVRDVSKNGTTLAGVLVSTPLNVESHLFLELGGQVQVRVQRQGTHGLVVTVLDETYVLPFGDVGLEQGVVTRAEDAWVVFAPKIRPCYLNGYQVVESVELCVGDELSLGPAGPPVIQVRR